MDRWIHFAGITRPEVASERRPATKPGLSMAQVDALDTPGGVYRSERNGNWDSRRFLACH
jgi:hypothetical protein